MATYKIRGSSHNVIYTYRTSDGQYKQQWESYDTELEAIQRKAYIDFLQKNKRQDDIRLAVAEYKEKRSPAKAVYNTAADYDGQYVNQPEDNTRRTYAEFIDRFLPFYARKQRFSPNTYDSYAGNLKNHILPYFGDCIMSKITSEDIDNFLDYLSKKPCKGSKSYGKKAAEAPKLSSATIKKCYNILMLGFPTAKKWRYVTEIPDTSKLATSTSSLILKGPKTEGSWRKQYLTTPLLQEIRRRLDAINANKEFLGPEYHDYGLLFCQPDGTPLDPKSLDKSFKERQTALHIEDQIEFQGLRKSGQMHKVRLSKNNYQLVAENSGQSPEVLMSNYNEALESEKRTLSLLVETSFYPNATPVSDVPSATEAQVDALLQKFQQDPALSQQLLQKLLSNALGAS